MDKLLIVDDEYLVREGLRSTVDWASLGIEIVGTAENGEQGLALARKLKPDLVIADVRMPVMDGLDMAKALFDENADLAIVIYSGYKDFDNARRAIDSGVASFLLKPIDNDELVARVREVMQKLHDTRRNKQMLGQFISNMPVVKQQQFENLLNADFSSGVGYAREQLALLGVNVPHEGTLIYCRTDSDDVQTFVDICDQHLCGAEYVSQAFKNYAVVLVCLSEADVLNRLQGLLDKLLTVTDARFNVAISAFNEDVSKAFKKAEQISRNTIFSAINAIATEAGEGKYRKLVRDAIKIIETDYDKKLSVKSVAEILCTSESHLMHEFKNQVGKTFNDCLTDFRMLKAQELLLKGDLRVGEIAYAVGYTDVKYFGQVFKEYMGCTPSEFLKARKQ